MRVLSLIFLTSFLLLSSFYAEQNKHLTKSFYPTPVPQWLKHFADEKFTSFEDESTRALGLSYIFGLNHALTPELKSMHQTLNLKHLFSPSGLHVSALFIFLLWMKHRPGLLRTGLFVSLLLGLSLSHTFLPGYFPLKRCLLFHVLALGLSYFRGPHFVFFLLTFWLDFSFGSFNSSPLSFIYSFLFLGDYSFRKTFYPSPFFFSL